MFPFPRRSCLLGSPHLNLKLSSVVFDRPGVVKRPGSGESGTRENAIEMVRAVI